MDNNDNARSTTNETGLPRPLLVSVPQAARLLAVGRTTLYELIRMGSVTPIHIGRCVRFSIDELERLGADRAGVD